MRFYLLITRDPEGNTEVANSMSQDDMENAPELWAAWLQEALSERGVNPLAHVAVGVLTVDVADGDVAAAFARTEGR